jgi:tetratricopeptide (TPR) repeat protein
MLTPLPGLPAVEGDRARSADVPTAGRPSFLLVLFVAALAFLLASFPARNSDLWAHLAAGRSLARGETSFGLDSQLPAELRVGHAWLYNLLCYALAATRGGTGLVLVKALLVVGLALLLLRLSWAGRGWALAACCTALALLTMSTRLLLQPATVSYFLLALALWFVRPGREVVAGRATPLLPPWPLLVLFAVWVNVDRWFVLGLGTVALVWLGSVADEAPAQEGRLGLLLRRVFSLAVLAAVCLLNPAHVHAFALPAPLGWFRSAAAPLAGQVTSPFQKAYFASFGLSPAGLAYFSLLGLGFLSFVLNLPRWSWQRFLPWLGLALLSAFQVRAVPFFAVVGGPILAWNLADWTGKARRGTHPARSRPRLLLVGRALAVVLGLLVLACAWPGWLQTPPFEPRRWAIETPPALERAASTVRHWHQEGKLGPDARALHLSAATASAFAWFCPEENGLLDDTLASAVRGAPGTPDDWDERLRSAGITHLVVYDPDRGHLVAVLGRLLADPQRWPLLYLEGDLAVFGCRGSFRSWRLDLNRLAFRPTQDNKAPAQPPEQGSATRRWWEAFWKPAPPSRDHSEAILYLLLAEALRGSGLVRHQAAWETSQSAALVAAAGAWHGCVGGGPGALLDAHVRLVLLRPQVPDPGTRGDRRMILDRAALYLRGRFFQQRDDTPPALLYLAIRAARRAVAVNPSDARAHLWLGESYLRLLHSTRERFWGERLRELVQLRRAQASAALNRAIALKPDLAQAHLSLSGLYREMNYLDLTLKHLRVYLDLVRKAGPPPEVEIEEFRAREAGLQQEVVRLAKEISGREDALVLESARKSVLDRAVLAMRKRLAGKALDLLLESHIAAFGPQGMALELELLLRTGRPNDLLAWLAPEHRDDLGASTCHWLRVQALAASGEYALARQECSQLARVAALGGSGGVHARQALALLVAQVVLGEQPGTESIPFLLRKDFIRLAFPRQLAGFVRRLRQEADVTVLRGLLALEEGEVGEAEFACREALGLWQDPAAAAGGSGLDFNARPVAQACLQWLE